MAVYAHIILKPHERIVRVYRRYPLMNVGHYFGAGVFLLLPFFFLFPLLRFGQWGIVCGVGLFCIGLFLLARTIFLWYHNVFLITTDRVIDFDQRGFFERVVSQSSHEKIQDVSFHIHGLLPTLLRYGDLNIKTAWGSVDLCVPAIYHPDRAQQALLDVVDVYVKEHDLPKQSSTTSYDSDESPA